MRIGGYGYGSGECQNEFEIFRVFLWGGVWIKNNGVWSELWKKMGISNNQ